jgi:hypothetical protein
MKPVSALQGEKVVFLMKKQGADWRIAFLRVAVDSLGRMQP